MDQWVKYRKKPVIVNVRGPVKETQIIKTLAGDMRVEIGDYVVCGVEEEMHPCKPYLFERLYEKVDE